MSTKPTLAYQFDGHNVRPVTEQDRPYLERQIEADPYHRGMEADYFLKPLDGESSWALEDADGRVVFYFKTSPAVRMSIQFTEAGKRKNIEGLLKGLAWIEAIFRATRFREIFFDTQGPELQNFAKRHLGFMDAPNLLSRLIPSPSVTEMQPRAVGTIPTDRLERTV
jgi:hypothetical protein